MILGLVSVVVCSYNNWPDVEMAIASALHQSYQPLEVIVVDNSSTDATPDEVPRRFGRSVHYMRQPNRQWTGAYNAGFGVARGEYIQFLDGDDVLAPNKVEKQVEVFRTNRELDIVYGDVRLFQTLGGVANWKDTATEPEDDMLRALVAPKEEWGGLTILGMLFHRKALERVGPLDERLYIGDIDFWLRAAYAGCRFGHCPGSLLAFYRIRPGQMTKDLPALAHGLEAVWEKALGYVEREPYRSLIAATVARQRFGRALSQDRLSRQERLAMLALARATSPETISAFACAAVQAAMLLPAGPVRSRWLRPIRRWVLARLLGQPNQRVSGGKRRSSGMEPEGGSQRSK
ncbi:MAG: hypothetical protein A3H27_03240 [Acidobacteria bacterium RIFCSPLOWO2_02_FULL_59_13]|nr:MAG: hypothetical protein A3H27_03240 [Acidobacteria bacterium RIFCSPLOWO2_02_FULL_59_13]OFW32089.1 MAG: hypothetical protein A3J28_08470 [Acidobacteria bacterium RIFCSPLOWO2_12_FULL_60_22]